MTQLDLHNMLIRLNALGISDKDGMALRRCEKSLDRWAELECGDGDGDSSWAIEREEQTGMPYIVRYYNDGRTSRRRIPDRENGALRRVAAIVARYPGLAYYHQGDPRGCALYIMRLADLGTADAAAVYALVGVACYAG